MGYDESKGIGFTFWKKMSENAHKIAQIDGLTGEKDTYGSLLRRCIRTAITMRSRGITPEDVVITCSLNYMDACVPLIATQFLGAISSALDPTLSLKDVIHLLKQVPPKIMFVMPNVTELIETALEEVGLDIEIVVFGHTTKHTSFSEFLQPNQLEEAFRPIEIYDEAKTALILFSSGTTGLPKGICVKNLAFLKSTSLMSRSGYYTDVILITTSFYWVTANLFMTATILMGTARIILPKFDSAQVWNAIEKYEPGMIFAPPLQLIELANLKLQLAANKTCSLKYFLTGGVPIFQKHIDVLGSAFPQTLVFQVYGQTETGIISTFSASNPEDVKLLQKDPRSAGKILPEFEYQIVDLETEEVLGPNKQGELLLKSEIIIFSGYYKVDSSDLWSNGWYRTGDIAYCNEDGCLYVVDRVKEMLKFQSWHVPPAAIENVLVTHPAVETCMVIGIPDEIDGDHPMAVVVLKKSHQDTTPEEIQEFVERQVDDRKKLRGGVRIIPKFPTFITGKMKRKVIRDLILAGDL